MTRNNVFAHKSTVTLQRFAGLPSYVLKAVAAIKTDGIEFSAIKEACNESGIAYECPGVIGETVIHFVFPKLKAGLLIRSDSSTHYKTKISKCENMGWAVTAIHISALRAISYDAIISQFTEFIATLKTSRKNSNGGINRCKHMIS